MFNIIKLHLINLPINIVKLFRFKFPNFCIFQLQHPVYCLNVVGTQNAHNLISVSTDGRLCSWNLDMLSQPQETLELQHKQAKPIAVTSFAFPFNDVNNFVLGSEEGTVYSGIYP